MFFVFIFVGLFKVCFLFLVFRARLLFVPVHELKRKGRLKPTTTGTAFFDRLRQCCKKPSNDPRFQKLAVSEAPKQ
jgi:hypothetical protein